MAGFLQHLALFFTAYYACYKSRIAVVHSSLRAFSLQHFLAFDASISPALHDTSVLMAGFLLQHFMAFCASISPALHETSVLMAGYLQLVALFSSRLVCLYKSRMCAISDLLAGSLHHAVFSSPAAFHALLSRIIYVFDDEAKLMPMAALCIQLLTVVSGNNGVIPHWPACFFAGPLLE